MKQSLIRWFVLTVAVWVAALIMPGIHYTSLASLLAASLVLGILNAFVKPVIMILSFPFILFTMGLFMLVINTLLLLLASKIVGGFYIEGFWSALGGAVIISIVGMFISGGKPVCASAGCDFKRKEPTPLRRNPPPNGKGPVIDI